MNLTDLSALMARRRSGGLGYTFDQFRTDPAVAGLRWPDDVLEQFLYDHGGRPEFIDDYGGIDLRRITWRLETIPAADFRTMPTGTSEPDCIEDRAKYLVSAYPLEVGRHWEEHGTWLRPPLLIDRRLLDPPDSGLQVLEGRTRVGALRGCENLHVASEHQAWVGRP
jgi:hypothetical protein